MARDKSGKHKLNYYVDFTEKDFVKELVEDINSKSLVEFDETKLTNELIAQILDKYSNQFNDEEALLEHLDDLDAIKRNNDFKEGGLAKLKQEFPLVFAQGLKANKVRNAGDTKQKATMRLAKYAELKEMWETRADDHLKGKILVILPKDQSSNSTFFSKDIRLATTQAIKLLASQR